MGDNDISISKCAKNCAYFKWCSEILSRLYIYLCAEFLVLWWLGDCLCGPVDHLWTHDDVIKWKHFPRNWPFVQGIHRSPVNSPHKGQRRGALMFPLICVGINGWENNREAGDLRCCRAHYDVIVMGVVITKTNLTKTPTFRMSH